MICLKVDINGETFCIAGVGDHGCISAFVNWVHIKGDEGEPGLPVQPGDVLLNVSGFKAALGDFFRALLSVDQTSGQA